jgi:hypothetical protein
MGLSPNLLQSNRKKNKKKARNMESPFWEAHGIEAEIPQARVRAVGAGLPTIVGLGNWSG